MQGVKFTGYLSREELAKVLPGEERLARGPVAVIECIQEIPCNPCERSCPFGAITVGQDITALPKLNVDKCRGCGLCISRCPGLAIFVVDATYSTDEALVSLPYEYLPLPQPGDAVAALDRTGKRIADAKVLKIDTAARLDGTTVVTLIVPRALVHEVRSFAPQMPAASLPAAKAK